MVADIGIYLISGGAASFVVGGVFYYAYWDAARFYERLMKLKHYEIDDDLLSDLKSSGKEAVYAAVTGEIKADGNIIKSKYDNTVEGVIQSTKVLEHRAEWTQGAKSWSNRYHTITNSWNTEPFSLVLKPNQSSVKVIDPSQFGKNSTLSSVYDHYEPLAKSSLAEKLFDTLRSEVVKGYKTVERMLLVGSEATIIGEISPSKYGNGFYIKPPTEKDLKYIITTGSFDLVKKEEGRIAKSYFWVSVVFGTIGGSLFLIYCYLRLKRYMKERTDERRKREAYNQFQALERDYANEDDTIDQTTCLVCLDNRRNAVILPCGHVCACAACLERLNLCPICRTEIERLVPMFTS